VVKINHWKVGFAVKKDPAVQDLPEAPHFAPTRLINPKILLTLSPVDLCMSAKFGWY